MGHTYGNVGSQSQSLKHEFNEMTDRLQSPIWEIAVDFYLNKHKWEKEKRIKCFIWNRGLRL